MPGSIGDPVVLDPFRTITEVGWNVVPKYIVLTLPVELVRTIGSANSCAAPEYDEFGDPIDYPDWPYEGQSGGWMRGYLSAWTLQIRADQTTGNPYPQTATGIWKHKSESLPVGSGEDDVAVSGVSAAALGSGSHGAWTYSAASVGGFATSTAIAQKPAGAAYEDSEYNISASAKYYEATSATIDVLSHAITSGDGECGLLNRGEPDETYQTSETAVAGSSTIDSDFDQAYLASADNVGSGSLSLSGMSLTYRGESFASVAYRHFSSGALQSPAGHFYFDGRVSTVDPYDSSNDTWAVSILFERQEAT